MEPRPTWRKICTLKQLPGRCEQPVCPAPPLECPPPTKQMKINSPLGSFEACAQVGPVETAITDHRPTPNFGSQPTTPLSALTSTVWATIFFKTMAFLTGAAWDAWKRANMSYTLVHRPPGQKLRKPGLTLGPISGRVLGRSGPDFRWDLRRDSVGDGVLGPGKRKKSEGRGGL